MNEIEKMTLDDYAVIEMKSEEMVDIHGGSFWSWVADNIVNITLVAIGGVVGLVLVAAALSGAGDNSSN